MPVTRISVSPQHQNDQPGVIRSTCEDLRLISQKVSSSAISFITGTIGAIFSAHAAIEGSAKDASASVIALLGSAGVTTISISAFTNAVTEKSQLGLLKAISISFISALLYKQMQKMGNALEVEIPVAGGMIAGLILGASLVIDSRMHRS